MQAGTWLGGAFGRGGKDRRETIRPVLMAAGGVLAPDEPESLIATGFLAADPWDYPG